MRDEHGSSARPETVEDGQRDTPLLLRLGQFVGAGPDRGRYAVPILLAAALACDLGLLHAAAGQGVTIGLGAVRLRVHSTGGPILVASTLLGLLVATTWHSARARLAALGLVVATGATAAVILARAAQAATPTGDMAVVELYVREALTGRLLLGPYSRFGWHHPGPLYFYLLAPLYAAGGAQTAALNAGAFVLSLAAIVVLVWTAVRTMGSSGSLAVLAAVTLCLWRVRELIDSAWNPHVVVLQSVALLSLCAAIGAGDEALLPLAALVASLMAQTHVALVPVSVALVSSALLAAGWGRRGEPSGRGTLARSLRATSWVLVVAWLFPLAEQLAQEPGNLTALWEFFVGRRSAGQPLGLAVASWAHMITLVCRPDAELAHGGILALVPSTFEVGLACGLLACTCGVAARARRTGLKGLGWLAGLSSLASGVALLSATRVEGTMNDHLLFWAAGIGALQVGVVAAAGLAWLRHRSPTRATPAAPLVALAHGVLLATLFAMGLHEVDRARQGSFPITVTTSAAPNFAASIRAFMASVGAHRPLVRLDESGWGHAAAVLLELNRHGATFTVEDDWLPMFPASYRETGREDVEITMASIGAWPELAARPGNVTIGTSTFLHVEGRTIENTRRR